ncbi:hypothetical protein FRC14_008192 [Serendipita sp. 396]|nr:hypothetical protein FRC14_008192 [Serendipita sp. 396]KAG8768475.1 hypothetical protein FRC15_005130 [Serendipita sp. 397]
MEENQILGIVANIQASDEIDAKLNYLQQLEQVCGRLKRRFMDEKHRQTLNPDDGVHKTQNSNWINKLPFDILLFIFDLLRNSRSVRDNATLILVCRRWRALISSTPMLWNQIDIAPNTNIQNIVECKRLAKFCIEKSGSSPLDITLDLSRLWSPYEAAESLRPYLCSESEYDDELELSDQITEDASAVLLSHTSSLVDVLIRKTPDDDDDDGDDDGDDSDDNDNDSDNNNDYSDDDDSTSIQTLDDRARPKIDIHHMDRWRCIQFIFGERMDSEFINSILSQLRHPAPILEKFVVKSYLGRYWLSGVEFSLYEPCLSFPSLKAFATSTTLNFRLFRCNRETLLSLSLSITPSSFVYLPNFVNLRHLQLILDVPEWQMSPDIPTAMIILPQLETLSLSGRRSNELAPLIDAPQLQYLILRLLNPVEYPSAQLFKTIHKLNWAIYFHQRTADMIQRGLSSVLRQCGRLTKLTLEGPCREESKHIVQQIVTEYSLPPPEITFSNRMLGDIPLPLF